MIKKKLHSCSRRIISSCFSLQLKKIIPDTRLKSVPKLNTEMSKLHKQNDTEFLHVYIPKEHISNKPEALFPVELLPSVGLLRKTMPLLLSDSHM